MSASPLPDASEAAVVIGEGARLWPTWLGLALLAAAWPVYGLLADDDRVLQSTWAPVAAAVFIGWILREGLVSRVVLDVDQLWVRKARSVVGPLRYEDIVAATMDSGRSAASFRLANRAGIGRVRRIGNRWGSRIAVMEQTLGSLHVVVVPRLGRSVDNRRLIAELGQRLLSHGVELSPVAQAEILRRLGKA